MSSQYNDEIFIETSRMKANYGLAWINTDFKGKADIWGKAISLNMFQGSFLCGSLTKDIQGKICIEGYPKQIMKARHGIKPYPRQSMQFTAVQDTFVYEGKRSENFGENAYIKVGNDGSGKYRSFVQFDLEQLPSNLYIADAYLVLQSQDSKAFEGLEISGVDRNWKENSITWNGHPQRGKFYQVEESLDKNLTTYKIKVKDIVRDWYNGDEKNNGFLLKAFNEDKIQSKSFTSKEYHFNNAPKLIVDYFDPELYIPEGGKVEGRVNVESKKEPYKAFNGKVYVDKEDMYSKIRCKLRVYPDMIEARANISVKNDIKSKVNVRYFEDSLKGKFDIQTDNLDESFKAKFVVSQTQIRARASVRWFNDDLKCQLKIADENNKLKCISQIQGQNDKFKGKADIRYIHEQFKGRVEIAGIFRDNTLKGKVSVLKTNDIKAKFNVRYIEDINGTLNIITTHDDNTLKGKFIVTRKEKAFDGRLSVIYSEQFNCKAKITREVLLGHVGIQVNNNELRSKFIIPHQTHFKAKVDVKYFSRIKGTVMTTANMISDINGRVLIAENELYYENNCYSYIL